jgi:uncharacterized protein YprB with RNaseH-like and TPR domain
MLDRTFQLIPGIGPYREKDLWARGYGDWAAFEEGAAREVVASKRLDEELLSAIGRARAAIAARDLQVLAKLLPEREHFRLYPQFADEAVFFDLEADGERAITVGGLLDRHGVATFIRGKDLGALPARLAQSRIWVTFNGRAFDVPVVRAHFPQLAPPLVHIDLRFLARTARLKGGLKAIEERLGWPRPAHLKGVKGLDAMRLWNESKFNARADALKILVEYNLYDAITLRSLLEWCLNEVREQWGHPAPGRAGIFERGDILYDVSRLVLSL